MDDKEKKTVLRMLTYGLYVLGAAHEGELDASTVTWVSQASFVPPLVMVGVKRTSRPFGLLSRSRAFALSVLESGQRDVAVSFFKSEGVVEGADGTRTLGGHAFELGAATGSPLIVSALGHLECRVRSVDETGDHAVVVAEIVAATARRPGTPLTLRELGMHYGG